MRARPCGRLGARALLLLVLDENPWISTQLTGAPAERARFEGAWYDQEGLLRVIVSGDSRPKLQFRQPLGWSINRMENAWIAGRELRFAVFPSGEDSPRNAVLLLTLEGEAELRYAIKSKTELCPPDAGFNVAYSCGNPFSTPIGPLKRNPSQAWFNRIAARHAGEAVHEMREAVFGRLARVL
jgi:hypothetical protein